MADSRHTARTTPRRRRVIGVFMAQLADAYQSAVWQGIERRAQEKGLGVVCFIGSRLESPVGSEQKANIAYGLADPRAIDGLVTVSSAIATFLEARGIERLFASRGSLPQVSIGLRVRGISSITVDSSGSVSEVIRHMAGHHRRRRFALIGGRAAMPRRSRGYARFARHLPTWAFPSTSVWPPRDRSSAIQERRR